MIRQVHIVSIRVDVPPGDMWDIIYEAINDGDVCGFSCDIATFSWTETIKIEEPFEKIEDAQAAEKKIKEWASQYADIIED